MSMPTPLFALLLCASPLVGQEPGHATWYPDFDTAATAAREAKKNLLVDFTGSDWCGWCIKLHDEVFQHEEFLKPATEGYILVSLDFPKAEEVKAKVPNPTRNEELRGKYEVQGFPTILLMTPEGEVFGRTGYQPGGPAKYVEHMNEIAKVGREALAKSKDLEKRFGTAKDKAKEAVVREAIDLLAKSKENPIGADVFERIARAAFELDPDNAKGLKVAAVEALLSAGKVDDDVKANVLALDPKNEKGMFEKLVLAQVGSVNSVEKVKAALTTIDELDALGIKDKAAATQIYTNAAFWNQRFTKDMEKAKKYAQKVLDLGVEDERMKAALEELVNG